VHPDKNPHPRAKEAFDAVQDAFRTLSTPLARDEYAVDMARKGKMTLKRVRRRVEAFFYNAWSDALLLKSRLGKGEGEQIADEWLEVRDMFRGLFIILYCWCSRKPSLLPLLCNNNTTPSY